ncbi:MAG TPA: PAS domain S-box protein [Hanamia sp.]
MKNLKKNSAFITKAASLLTIVAGCLVLAGWIFNIPSFKSIFSGIISIKFNTGACFILSGITLYLMEVRSRSQFKKNIASVCSWIVLIIAILNLSEYIFRFNLGIDELLWKEGPGTIATIFPGRMSISTAVNFTLLGFIFPLLDKKKYHWLIQSLLIAIIASSMFGILTYLFDVSFLDSFPQVNNTALPVAILFIVLCLGIFKSRPLGYIHFSFQKKIVGFFVLILLVLGIIFFAFNKNTEQIGEEKNLSMHAHRVMVLADEVNTEAYAVQSGLSSYILTGEGNFPLSLTNASDTINIMMAGLRKITKSYASIQMQLDTLEKNLNNYIAFQKDLLNIRREEGYEVAQNKFQKEGGKILLNGIDSIISVIEQNEVQAMKERESQIEQSIHNSSKIFNLFLVIAFILLLIGFIIIYKNNWKRNKAEEALKKSLKEISDYKYALDESSIVVITDQHGIINKVNDNFCKITKYTREELIGQDHRIFNSGYHTKEFIRDLWITINNGEVWKGEIKNKAKDGTYFWLDSTIVPFMNEHGKPYQYVAIRSDVTKRKKLEDEIIKFNQELQKRVENKTMEVIDKEQQYRFLLQNMREGIQVIGYDWRYLFVNNSVVEQSKYSNEELLGYTMMEKYPGIENTELFKVLQRCMKDRSFQIFENEFTFPDGTKGYFELSIQPIPEGLFIISMDVSERKKIEKQISNYKFALDEASLISVTDEKGIILHVNENFCRISKYSQEELIGKDHRIFNSGYHTKAFIKNSWGTITNGKVWRGELKNKAKDGTYFWVDTTIVPFLGQEGNPFQYMTIRSDITQRKNSEAKTQEAIERYDILSQATSDTIWDCDIINSTMLYNDGITKMFGYEYQEIDNVIEWWEKNIHFDDKERVLKKINDHIENGLQNWQDEYRFCCADGTYKDVFDRGYILFDENKKPCRMIGAMTDLTEKKRLEKELVKQQLKQQKMLMEVALQAQEEEKNELGRELHDNINQIMATVKIYLGMAKSGQDTPEDLVGKSYEYVIEAMEEIRKLSHSLVPPSLGEISLKEALEELLENINLFKNIQVHLLIDEKYNDQLKDNNIELMLYRIVQEQLNNINKYAQATEIVISLKKNDGNLVLSIADNGVGFDISQKSKGIGLKNIESRVKFYSGNINIISAPGQGCALEVFIPF